MMGFYPVNPCGDGYVLGAPQAEEIKLNAGNSETGVREFRIYAAKDAKPVAYLDGRPVEGVKISHETVMSGGELRFSR